MVSDHARNGRAVRQVARGTLVFIGLVATTKQLLTEHALSPRAHAGLLNGALMSISQPLAACLGEPCPHH